MGKRLLPVLIIIAALFFIFYQGWFSNQKAPVTPSTSSTLSPLPSNASQPNVSSPSIEEKTQTDNVANYLQVHHQLPDFYITKKEARDKGWNAKKGNLCEVLPGRAIGGDRYTNREGLLPEQAERQWFEADVNYHCGHRGSDRLLFSNDGLIYLTTDHYRTVTEVTQ